MRTGQIVITEGHRRSIISWAIRLVTGSWWTHVFMIMDDTLGIEASWPRVRMFDLKKRFKTLERQKRSYVILEASDVDSVEFLATANKYIGRKYDLAQIFWFTAFRRFIEDGPLQVVCSRLVTAVYDDMGIKLLPGDPDNGAAPHQLFNSPILKIVKVS